MFKYIKFEKDEILNLIILSLLFSFFFAFSIIIDNPSKIFNYFIFIFIIQSLKLLIMKIHSYINGYQIQMYITKLNRFGFKEYHKFSYYSKKIGETKNFNGISSVIISIFLYILTGTFIIFTGLYNYKKKEIPHRFIGYRKRYEKMPFIFTPNYRFTLTIFWGFIFYLITLITLRFLRISNYDYFYILFFLIIGNFIPIPGNEGFELFLKNKFLWFSILSLFIIAITLFIINNFIIYIVSLIIISFLLLIRYLWKDIIK